MNLTQCDWCSRLRHAPCCATCRMDDSLPRNYGDVSRYTMDEILRASVDLRAGNE